MKKLTLAALVTAGCLTLSTQPLKAADHREAPAVNGAGEGDIGDIFAFLDPNDNNRIVLVIGVNPFAVPAIPGSYKFSPDYLYQLKVDRTGDYNEDFVVQVLFDGTAGASQTYRVYMGAPEAGQAGALNRVLNRPPALEGSVNRVNTAGEVTAWAGLREDTFVFDASQLNRILAGTQDVFRQVTTPVPAIGTLRGRAVRADGTSGHDTFGGFNGSFFVISFPKSMIGSGTVNTWGTVSAPIGQEAYIQFERMGQQAFSTVFVPAPLRDIFNLGVPADDVARFSNLVPDALTTTENDGRGNTVAGRRAVLNALGLTRLPGGASLLLPENFANTNRNLLRVALLPDVLRIDLSRPSADTAIGQFGLQNGRRPGDDVVDILLRLARELADVNFPDALGVPGSGPARAGALPFSDRRVLAVLQGTDFIKPDRNLADLGNSGNEVAIPNEFPFLPPPIGVPVDPAPAPSSGSNN